MTLFYYGLWMLCGIGGAVFAADAAVPRRNLFLLAAGFAAGAILFRQGRLPDVTWVAGGMLLLAAYRVVKATPLAAACASAGAGVIAAAWGSLFAMQGVPVAAALPLAGIVPVLSAWLAARSDAFAPAGLRDEALLILAALAAVLAVAPGLVAGWQSAVALNLAGKREAAEALPGWTILMAVFAASFGGVYSLWTRR